MSKADSEFMTRMRAGFLAAQEEERDIRLEASQDVAFRAGEQWNPTIKKSREDDNRPALTCDRTHVFIQSVSNEARQNKPQPRVNPIGGGATTDVAIVINGILRHVQYRSKADIAYDTALDHATGNSFGFVRAITEYLPKSFDQEIRILTVPDPFAVYGVLVPYCRGEKCRQAYVVSYLTKAEYKRKYGTSREPVDFESTEWKTVGDWIDQEKVRVAEYWWLEEKKKTLRQVTLPDGSLQPIYADDPQYSDSLPFALDPETHEPLERDEDVPEVKFCTVDGVRKLPGTETVWPGDCIPIFPCVGQQLIVDGDVRLFSLIRFVHDTQQLINIYESAIAEKIGLANRIPYLGFKGQFKDPKWKDCNLKNYAYLEAEIVPGPNGMPLPLPQRQQLEEQIQALSHALAQEIQNLKDGMGIYDASLGNRSNETSGAGIQSRQQQSNITNYHFSDNLNRTEWDLCAALLKVIPKVYDRPGRQVRIVGEDQQHSVVVVNQPYQDPENGKQKTYMLDVGDYDVVVTTGPSYTTARQEGADTLQQFFKAAPQTVPLLGDLWVGSLDYPWSREAARRLKLAAPQNIVQDADDQQQIPPQVQQQMQKLQQDAANAHAFAQSLHEQLQTKQPEIDMKLAMQKADLDFKREQLSVTAAIGEAQAKNTAAIALLNQEINVIKHERGLAADALSQASAQNHALQLQAGAQQHQAGMQQQAAQNDASAQAADQQHQAGMQASDQAASAEQAQQQAEQQQQQPQAA